MKAQARLTIYTDGGYSMQNNEGAFAFIILDENGMERCRKAEVIHNQTNNRAELQAIINAARKCPNGSSVLFKSDSQYAINTLTGKWKAKTNLDLIKEWNDILRTKGLDVTLQWVKGHDGNRYNELCDMMCNEAVGYDLNTQARGGKQPEKADDAPAGTFSTTERSVMLCLLEVEIERVKTSIKNKLDNDPDNEWLKDEINTLTLLKTLEAKISA